jgi:hypothetical protein
VEATYTPPGPRSTAAILALYVGVGACALGIGADARRIVVAGRLGDGRSLPDDLAAADQLVALATLVGIVAFVVAATLFLRWQATGLGNLPVLGDPAPPGVGEGLAAWFVPGVNLVRPRTVMGAVWRAGDPERPLPRMLGAWWTSWLVAVLAVILAWTVFGQAADVGARERIDALRAAATPRMAVAAGLAIVVVTGTTARQDDRARAVGARRAAPPEGDEDTPSAGRLQVLTEAESRARSSAEDRR